MNGWAEKVLVPRELHVVALASEPDAGLLSNQLVRMNTIVDRPRQAAEEAQRDEDLRHIRSPHRRLQKDYKL